MERSNEIDEKIMKQEELGMQINSVTEPVFLEKYNTTESAQKDSVNRIDDNNVQDSIDKQNEFQQNSLVSQKTIIDSIEKANKKLIDAHTELQFSIHEKTKEIMVKIVNADTKEVIREIPPEEALDRFAKMLELSGLIVDKKV